VPRDTFTHSSETTAPIGRVWAALDEPSTWEAIGGIDRVLDPVIDSNGHLRGFAFEVVAGGRRYHGRAKPLHRELERLMAWSVDTSEVSGTTSVEISPNNAGTLIAVTLEVESKGLLSTMFFPVISSTIGTGLPRSVDDFAERLSV
jgi:carbon monoxide dehydrogenase subunit G